MGTHEQAGPARTPYVHGWVDAPPPSAVPVVAAVPIPPPGEFDPAAVVVPAEYVPVRFPPDPVGFTTAAPRIRPLQWDQPRAQRLRGSQVTFGILGRSATTGVILLFVAWLAWTAVFFLIPALPAVAWLLKDTWRRAPERRAPEPTHLAEVPRTAPRDPFAPLTTDVVLDSGVQPPGATPSA